MDVTPTAAQPTQTTQAAPATGSESAMNSDFETFLRMLTAQLQNQDPLNPLESQDFAVQLATFSNVEQQTRTNQLLEEMTRSMDASGLGEMSSWIGREAQISGTLPFTGTPLDLHTQAVDGAITSELVVKNARGQEVARHPLDQNADTLTWTGITPEGIALAPGIYEFSVENTASEGELPDGAVSAYLPVLEARVGPRGQSLLIEGDMEVTPDAVTALRNPPPVSTP